MHRIKTIFLTTILMAAVQPLLAQRMVQASSHIRVYETDEGFELIAQVGQTPLLVGYSDESTFDEACKDSRFREMLKRMEMHARKATDLNISLPRRLSPKARIPASFGTIFKPANVDGGIYPPNL